MEPTRPTDLCVPIYLNQKIVFDVLAMMEDGFSQLSTLKTSASETETLRTNYGGGLGVSNVFAFLGITLKGERGGEHGAQDSQEATAEKVHTPASLFSKLRAHLGSRDLISEVGSIESLEQLRSGQFVEFRAVLRKNPLVEYIETFRQVLDIADLFPDEAVETSHGAGPAGRGKKLKPAKPDQKKNQDLPLY
jgi:hypothetical protein